MTITTESKDDAETNGDTEADPLGQLFDLVAYALALLLHFAVLSAVLATVLGTPVAPGVKYGLFVLGWLAFGYAAVLIFPKSAWDDDYDYRRSVSGFTTKLHFSTSGNDDAGSGYDPFGVPPDEETGFQSLAQRLPPARFRQIRPIHRLPTGVRLLAASLVALGTSFVLGQVFGIGP